MALWTPLLAVALTGTALLLVLVSALAANRTGALRFVFAALAFGVFALRGLLILLDGSGVMESPIPWNTWSVGTDAVTLGLLYLAIVKG